jgi:hypothetical protein
MILLLFAALIVLSALLSGYVLMVLLGALGHIFGAEWLFISFWQAVIVGIALSVLAGYFKQSSGK